MSLKQVALSLAAIAAAATFFIAAIFYTPLPAAAGSSLQSSGQQRSGAQGGATASSGKSSAIDAAAATPAWPKADVVIARPKLDRSDEIAALEALQLALTQVGDGSSYVWHRRNGRLSGIVKPTASFRDAAGLVCRHLEFWLSSGSFAKRTEGIACRQPDGIWSLGG